MKIAFFGLPVAALCLLREGHEVVLASLSRKKQPGERRLRARLGERVRVTPRVDAAFVRELRGLAPDLVVSWFWTKKLPMEAVEVAPLGGFGVHPSLLPRWRGPDPYFWAIDAGDATTGVTAHRLAAEYDTGAILERREVAIDDAWDSWRLARALDRPSLELLRDIVAQLARGERLVEVAQDERLVTLAPEPDDALLAIDWNRDAASIVRRIRAAAPYPGAFTFIGDDDAVVVTRASVAPAPRGLLPGEATVVDGRAVVAARGGGVALVAGRRIDDEAETPLDAGDLAALVERARCPSPGVSR